MQSIPVLTLGDRGYGANLVKCWEQPRAAPEINSQEAAGTCRCRDNPRRHTDRDVRLRSWAELEIQGSSTHNGNSSPDLAGDFMMPLHRVKGREEQ